VPSSPRCRPREDGVDTVDLPSGAPEVETDNPVFVPPFTGSRIVKGIPLDDIAAYINETALFRNQWGFRPENGEDDAAFKERLRPQLREQLAKARPTTCWSRRWSTATSPANGDGNDLVIWADETRTEELTASASPASTREPHLCIADFFRPIESGTEVDYVGFHIVTMGERVSERTGAVRRRPYQDYLMLHGIGVEMAEALAEYWHRRIREEWGFADEDGPSIGRPVPPAVPRRPLLVGLPGLPQPRGQRDGHRRACSTAERIGIEVNEETGWQYQPEQTTSAIICHHPRAKYFVARWAIPVERM
jgi:5-methyltetrahydrofolate--homocysteine methyltransferase